MLIPFDTLLPTTKPSAKPNCVTLLATSWAVFPDVPRPLTRTDFDVETGLLVEAFVLRNQETGIWPLVEPVEPHGHLPLRLRAPATHKRDSGKAGRNADLT
jgi:hypothetical protein